MRQLAQLGLLMFWAAAVSSIAAEPHGTPNLACDDLRALPLNINVQWQDDEGGGVYSILRTHCAACHSVSGPRRFRVASTADQTLQLLLGEPGLVIALAARSSELLLRINCVNAVQPSWRMPRCSTVPCSYRPLSDQALIYDWIAQGARGEAFGQAQSDVVFTDSLESGRR